MIETNEIDPKDPSPFHSGNTGGTDYELTCDMCHTVHNAGHLNEQDGPGDVVVQYVSFGPWTIADCCFRRFEEAYTGWFAKAVPFLEREAQNLQNLAIQREEEAARGRVAYQSFETSSLRLAEASKPPEEDDVPF